MPPARLARSVRPTSASPRGSGRREIVVLGLPGCLPSGLIGLIDLFNLVERATEMAGATQGPAVRVRLAGLTARAFIDGHGRRHVPDLAFADAGGADAILVPGFLSDLPTLERLGAKHPALFAWLRRRHAAGSWVLGSCAGSWVLGQAGLLRGRRCTTTWWLHEALAQRFPDGDWAYGAPLTEDQRIVTAGGPMSWVDIALATVRVLCGAEVARALADFAVLDAVPLVQSSLAPVGAWAQGDDFVQRAAQWVRQARAAPLSTTQLAHKLGVSTRTLHRRLHASTGDGPLAFSQRVRLEAARTLLESSTRPVKAVAHETGWQDEGSFRRAFRKLTGHSPTGYRAWARARRAGPLAT